MCSSNDFGRPSENTEKGNTYVKQIVILYSPRHNSFDVLVLNDTTRSVLAVPLSFYLFVVSFASTL